MKKITSFVCFIFIVSFSAGAIGETGEKKVLPFISILLLADDDDGDGYTILQGDCDDRDPSVYPGAIEICGDGIDNDCDGNTDCADTDCQCTVWYRDSDGDGYGDAGNTKPSVSKPDGYVSNSDDCDDSDPTVYPGATEICGDEKDNNQDGVIDEGCVLYDGLVAYYPFDGNAADESSNNNHGTVYGAVLTTDRFDSDDSAYSFDGIDDVIDLGTGLGLINNTDAFTIAAWVYPYEISPSDAGRQYTILGERSGGDNYQFAVMDNYFYFSFWSDGSEQMFHGNQGTIQANQWCFLVATYDGTTVKLYINGELDKEFAASGNIDGHNSTIYVGSWNGTDGMFNGKIDDILIFSRVLPEEEIVSVFEEGIPSWWLDDDGDGDGYSENQGDCDDSDPLVSPAGTEVCDDGMDNDCDGGIDCDDAECNCSNWYRDADEDGYGDPDNLLEAPSQPVGYVSDNTDCGDTDQTIHPGATEICDDGKDYDCDGDIEDLADCVSINQFYWEDYISQLSVVEPLYDGLPTRINVEPVWFKSLNVDPDHFSTRIDYFPVDGTPAHGVGQGSFASLPGNRRFVFYSNWSGNPNEGSAFALEYVDDVPISLDYLPIEGSNTSWVLKNQDGSQFVLFMGFDEGKLSVPDTPPNSPCYLYDLTTREWSQTSYVTASHNSIPFDYDNDGDEDIVSESLGAPFGGIPFILQNNNSIFTPIQLGNSESGSGVAPLGYQSDGNFWLLVTDGRVLPEYGIGGETNYILQITPDLTTVLFALAVPPAYFEDPIFEDVPLVIPQWEGNVGNSSDCPAALIDLDYDGDLDIIVSSMIWSYEQPYGVLQFLINENGTYYDDTENRLYNWIMIGGSPGRLDFIDVNGDGHVDLLASGHGRPFGNEYDLSILQRSLVLINDGTGHFVTVIHQQIDDHFGYISCLIPNLNAQNHLRWTVIDPWGASPVRTITRMIDMELSTGPNMTDPALSGAPGFNEFYYLLHNPDVVTAIENGEYETGLEHYLQVGQAEGRASYAATIMLSATGIIEYSPIGTVVGQFSAVDPSGSDTHAYSFAAGNGTNDADNGSFVIDGDTLKTNVETNYPAKPSYNIYVKTDDGFGRPIEKGFTIAVTPYELAAFYPFNGNADDQSGHDHDGTVNGASLTTDRFGSDDSAYSFDGVDDVIDLGTGLGLINNSDTFTIAAWVYPYEPSSPDIWHYTILGERDGGDNYQFMLTDYRFYGSFWSEGSEQWFHSNEGTIQAEQWYFLVATYDGTSVKLYINGELDTTIPASGNVDAHDSTLFVGSADGSQNMFRGKIDDILIFNRTLPQEEITSLFENGLQTTWLDNDGDGDGYTENQGDCDDSDPSVNPEGTEICDDGMDNDCDGNPDCNDDECSCSTWYRDADGDGYGDLNNAKEAVSQPDGYVSNSDDWDDTDPTVYSGAAEICGDGKDNDQNGEIDEGCPLESGYVAYYPFNGNPNDESGHDHHGIVSGAVLTTDRHDRQDSAYSFDGVDDIIDLGTGLDLINNSDHFTIAAWINLNEVSPPGTFRQYTILGERSAGNNYQFTVFDNQLGFSFWSDGTYLSNRGHEGIIQPGKWYFVAVTYDGTIVKLFINAEIDETLPASGTVDDHDSTLYIGSWNGTEGLFDGKIDEVIIVNRAATETEILTLFEERFASPWLDHWENYMAQLSAIEPVYNGLPTTINVLPIWFKSLNVDPDHFSSRIDYFPISGSPGLGVGYGSFASLSDNRQIVFYSNWNGQFNSGSAFALEYLNDEPVSLDYLPIEGATHSWVLDNQDGSQSVVFVGVDEGKLYIPDTPPNSPSYLYDLTTNDWTQTSFLTASHNSIPFDYDNDGDEDIVSQSWGEPFDGHPHILRNDGGTFTPIQLGDSHSGMSVAPLGFQSDDNFWLFVGDGWQLPDYGIGGETNYIEVISPDLTTLLKAEAVPPAYFEDPVFENVPMAIPEWEGNVGKSHDVSAKALDLDYDGDLDIIVSSMLFSNEQPYCVLQFLINEDGVYQDDTANRLYNWILMGWGMHRLDFVDVNGDNHVDILISDNGDCLGDYAPLPILYNSRVLINDGTGHFVTVVHQQICYLSGYIHSLIPSFNAQNQLRWTLIDTRGTPNVRVFTRMLDMALSTGPNMTDPALSGAPGFNEFYYLLYNPDVVSAIENGEYTTGLEHYLQVGQAEGRASYAASLMLSSTGILEYSPIGKAVGKFSTAGPVASDSPTYSFATGDGTNDADNGSFAIDGDILKTSEGTNYPAQPSYNIYVRTDDGFGKAIEQAFVIEVIPYGLAAYYPFNGNADDQSGNIHHGTVSGASLTTDRFDSENSAYSFDGVDDVIDLGTGLGLINNSDTFTIAAWVYPHEASAPGSWQYTILGERNNGDNYQFTMTDNQFYVSFWSEGIEKWFLGNQGTIQANQWYFLVATYDGMSIKLYINGELDKAIAASGNIDGHNSTLFVGSTTGSQGMFKGKIDDIRLFRRVLPQEEIISLFEDGGWSL